MHGENTCLLLYKLLLGKQSLKVVFPLLYIPGVNGTVQILKSICFRLLYD